MDKQILFTIPLDEFESNVKNWVKDALSEIHPPSTTDQVKPRETYGTRKEVAKELKISLPTLNELTKTGVIKSYRISGRVLYRWEDVQKAVTEVRTIKYRKRE